MNTPLITSFLQNNTGLKTGILLFYLLVAFLIVGYNWLYLRHSLHVSSKHIGINSPPYIKRIIRASIVSALFTAALIGIFLVLGVY